ncbi:MAG: hypothetical protein H6R18_2671 [Proteobacteria bacterium]|nr:hypothetical protein [Pseudomonadota bacterium]
MVSPALAVVVTSGKFWKGVTWAAAGRATSRDTRGSRAIRVRIVNSFVLGEKSLIRIELIPEGKKSLRLRLAAG